MNTPEGVSFLPISEVYFTQATESESPDEALRAVDIGLDLQTTPLEKQTAWGLAIMLERGKGNSAVFEEYLRKQIENYTGYVSFDPENTDFTTVLEELTALTKRPLKWHEYCMKQSRSNHAVSEQYRERGKYEARYRYKDMSNGWAESAGRIMREQAHAREVGVPIF